MHYNQLRSKTACSVEGCDKRVQGRGLCTGHYARWTKGKPLVGKYVRRTGPYKGVKGKTSYEDRVAARQAPAPSCPCGCGEVTPFDVSRNKYRSLIPGHRINRPYHSAQWLRTEYVDRVRSLQEIADECGVSIGPIKKAMERHGIPTRTQAETLRRNGKTAGSNNPSWKGGVTPARQKLYKTLSWRQLVQSVFAPDNFTCQRCGDRRNAIGPVRHSHRHDHTAMVHVHPHLPDLHHRHDHT